METELEIVVGLEMMNGSRSAVIPVTAPARTQTRGHMLLPLQK